nr:protein PELPK1-like [Loxodonta africana]
MSLFAFINFNTAPTIIELLLITFLNALKFSSKNKTNIFKVPEMPKKLVPVKKEPVPVTKKPEVLPEKEPEVPEEIVPEEKVSVLIPEEPEAPPAQVEEAPEEIIYEEKASITIGRKETPPVEEREIEKYIEPKEPEPEPQPEEITVQGIQLIGLQSSLSYKSILHLEICMVCVILPV